MSKRIKYTRISNICTGIALLESVAVLAVNCWAFIKGNEWMGTMVHVIDNASEHDLTGGYEAVGGGFGFMLGLLMNLALIVIGVGAVACAIVLLICLIHGICAEKTTDVIRRNKRIRRDAIVKLIFSIIGCVSLFGLAISMMIELFAIAGLPFIGMLIMAVKTLNAPEDIPAEANI